MREFEIPDGCMLNTWKISKVTEISLL